MWCRQLWCNLQSRRILALCLPLASKCDNTVYWLGKNLHLQLQKVKHFLPPLTLFVIVDVLQVNIIAW